MGYPIDPSDPEEDTEAERIASRLSSDPEVPEADAIEQAEEVGPSDRFGPVSRDIEVPEADAIEQAFEVSPADLYDP
jgi:hypothetical protein